MYRVSCGYVIFELPSPWEPIAQYYLLVEGDKKRPSIRIYPSTDRGISCNSAREITGERSLAFDYATPPSRIVGRDSSRSSILTALSIAFSEIAPVDYAQFTPLNSFNGELSLRLVVGVEEFRKRARGRTQSSSWRVQDAPSSDGRPWPIFFPFFSELHAIGSRRAKEIASRASLRYSDSSLFFVSFENDRPESRPEQGRYRKINIKKMNKKKRERERWEKERKGEVSYESHRTRPTNRGTHAICYLYYIRESTEPS